MKTYTLLVFLFCLSFSGHTQEDSLTIFTKNHEIKVGALKLLAGSIFEGSYEYIPNRNIGFGASLLWNFDTSNNYFENSSLTPFFKMYFQRNEHYGAKGFFVEAFGSLYSANEKLDSWVGSNNDNINTFFETALGFSIGQKWINSTGFIFEIKFGYGRNLLGNSRFDGIAKGGFYVGYRF